MKKIFLTILMTFLILSGCNNNQENEKEPQAEQQLDSIETKKEKNTNNINQDNKTYKNEDLGISFQYPINWDIWENKGNKGLEVIKFKDDTGNISNDMEIYAQDTFDNSFDFSNCEDILSNGYADLIPSICKTISVDNNTIIISTYRNARMVRSDHFKEAQILTKKGIFFFNVYNEELFDEYLKILNSFKFDE